MGEVERLSAAALCWRCTPDQFAFESTDDLEDLVEVMGQERAVEALRFGIGMRRAGYNIYALGPEGIGKHTVARRFLEEQAREAPLPLDWCYVSNFKEPRKPRILQLNAGRGAVFQADMARFVEDVRHALRSAFESEEYRTRRQVLEEEIKERQEHALEKIEEDAKARGIALMRTPVGFAFAPVTDGKVISPEVGSSSHRMHRPTVVLPEPLSPTSPSVSPRATVKLTSLTAWTSPTLRARNPAVIGKYFVR